MNTAAQAIARIGRLQAMLHDLALVPRRVAEIAAPRLTKLLQDEFRQGQDPYGNDWAPLAASTLARGRHPPPLTDKRPLRRGTRAMVNPGRRAGIRILVGAPYGAFHQLGFRVGRTKVPPRRILPQFGMPKTWRAVLEKAARQAFREVVRT